MRLSQLKPLDDHVDPRAYVKELIRINEDADGVEHVELYHPSDFDVEVRCFNLKPWKSDKVLLEIAKQVKQTILPHSIRGDRNPMVNNCVGASRVTCKLKSVKVVA